MITGPALIRKLFARYIKEPEKKEDAHAKLSASGSERWLGCPGSIRMSTGIEEKDNEHSIRGTHTHTLLQFILENYASYALLLSHRESKAFKDHIAFDGAMFANAKMAAEYVMGEKRKLELLSGKPVRLYVEQKVELEDVGFGTADTILYQPFGTLHIMDYKNGRSKVEAEENTQGLYYACAAADLVGWDIARFKFTIIQPNAPHPRGSIRTWEASPKRLEQAHIRFKEGARATRRADAPLVADPKWCWFCLARPICPKQMEVKERKVSELFKRPTTGKGRS